MVGSKRNAWPLGLALLILACLGAPVSAQWQSSQLLNPTWETYVKAARICPARSGGFHCVYNNAAPTSVQYRRYIGGYLGPVRTLDSHAVPQIVDGICEAGNGDIHVVWEDWEDANYCGWARSSDGGDTFSYSKLTSWGGVKYPMVVPFGSSTSPDVIMSFGRVWDGEDKDLWWRRYNGSSWSGLATMGSFSNEYFLQGMCQSLQDGTVYRSYGRTIGGQYTVCYRRYDGSSWGPEVTVAQPGFFSRQSIAVNQAGQIMVVYEGTEVMLSKLYTPGVGWSAEMAQQHLSTHGDVTAIPGTNDFYLVYTYDMKRIYGTRYSGGGWLPKELISVGLPDAFTVGSDVCAQADGTIYACWEYWATGQSQQWFNVRPGNAGPIGTVSGYVRDQFGAGISGVTVGSSGYATITGAAGAYSLQLPAGTQSISANKDYYTGQSIAGVEVAAGQITSQDFTITANPPGAVLSFAANASDGLNRLVWGNPAAGNFQATMIRFRTSGYPIGPTDGTLLCDRANSPGSLDNYAHDGLSNGVTYYYAAFAHDSDGHYAAPVLRSAAPHALPISEIKQFADGYVVDLRSKAVTGVFSGDSCIYVEEPDRTCAIRVATSATGIAVGDRVDVTGILATRFLSGMPGERAVSAPGVTKVGTGPVPPVAMQCGDVGGATNGLALGVVGGIGLNNMGMLVTIAGELTYKITQYVYVDDGSNVQDILGRVGVMVRCPSSAIPANVGDTVRVTGVVEGSVPSGWTANRRSLRMRDWNDLSVVGAPPPDTGIILGGVMDQSGDWVAGAVVSTSPGGYSAPTDEHGGYTITAVPVGTYSVTASKSGYTPQTVANVVVTKEQRTIADFTLPPAPGSITGYVQASSGAAIAGASVSANPGGYSTTTAADGFYTLTNVPVGTYNVSAARSGYSPQTNTDVVVPAGGSVTSSFSLTPTAGTITGIVRDQLGTAVSGATVSTNTGGYSTTSNASGSYTLASVLAGTYNVTAAKTGYQSGTQNGVVVAAGQTTTANISVTALGVQKLLNGSFEGGYFNSGWWGGYCANNWGFVWKGTPGDNWFYQNSYSYGGTHGVVHLVQNKRDNYEVGIGQEITGLTPGATYTLTAESYKPAGCNYTIYLAVRSGTGYGSEMGSTAGTAFTSTAATWVSQTVTGTVPAGGGIAVYLWVKRPSGASQYDVYFDNASLVSW